NEQMKTSKVDTRENYFIGGHTTAANYPVSSGAFNAGPTSPSSIQFGVYNKFGTDGKLLYGTYYGGSSTECGTAYTHISDIAIDSLFNTYIVGETSCSNLPMKPKSGAISYTTSPANTSGQCRTAFIAKLDSAGKSLHFTSY